MSRGDASGHLAKAREFLDAASAAHDAGQHSAAASSAVVAGINAKDTICLVLTGTTGKSEDHRVASAELRRTGPIGAGCANDLDRLLVIKSRVQYQSAPTSSTDSAKAVERARRLVAVATQVTAAEPTLLVAAVRSSVRQERCAHGDARDRHELSTGAR